MKIQVIPVGDIAVNCYIVSSEDMTDCFLIDPGDNAEQILKSVESRKVEAVLLTHAHFDHIGAVDSICAATGAPLYLHELDIPKLKDVHLNAGVYFDRQVIVNTVPNPIRDGDQLRLCGATVRVLHTPGHSAGSVCYLLNGEEAIFTGDTLFSDGYGRTDFPDGSFTELRESLKKLFHLSPKRPAYPGHGASCFAGRNETH